MVPSPWTGLLWGRPVQAVTGGGTRLGTMVPMLDAYECCFYEGEADLVPVLVPFCGDSGMMDA